MRGSGWKNILKDKWYQDGPIILRTMDLYLYSSEARLKLKIKNISDQEISGVKILIKTWNVFHETIDNDFPYFYKDLKISPGKNFGDDIYITLPSAQTGFVDIEVQKVLFSSGAQWEGSEKVLIDLLELEKFRPDDYLYDLLRLKTGKEIFDYLQKVPFKEDDFFTDQVLPRLEEIVELEQSQGNQKTNVLVLLKGLYQK